MWPRNRRELLTSYLCQRLDRLNSVICLSSSQHFSQQHEGQWNSLSLHKRHLMHFLLCTQYRAGETRVSLNGRGYLTSQKMANHTQVTHTGERAL